MICTLAEIESIIKTNPNKDLIQIGKKQCEKLMLHLHGEGLTSSVKQHKYFENDDIFKERQAGTVSNKDMFARVLQSEDMVFTAQGGVSSYQGLSKQQTQELNATLDSIRFGMNLRKWVKVFALDAYRCDPMGVIFIESDGKKNCYPTYKCVSSIYDYLPNGRQLEYICFNLTVKEAIDLGVQDEKLKKAQPGNPSSYFRFVDDSNDYIFKSEEQTLSELPEFRIKNNWGKTPAFIVSDIIQLAKDKYKFISPLDFTVELADCFLNDRSIRDLQKKYSGFAKTIEPLLQCGTCEGTGYLNGASCPECTPIGSDHGLGYKLRTKVADVARFPLSALSEGFDYNRIFGYVKPPIETWDKQDLSLNDLENLIKDVYWGTDQRNQTNGPNKSDKTVYETATKTLANLQPKYARLNMTADWAESTENLIVSFIGKYYYDSFKKSLITYGRFYILETPDELMFKYLDMKSQGASQFSLFDALRKYYHSLYQNNPLKLAISLKLVNIEPFVHNTTEEVKGLEPPKIDYLCKLYFSEWVASLSDEYLLVTDEQSLKKDLLEYMTKRQEIAEEEASKKETITLAEKIGVGGTQSFQLILSDPNMSDEQKKWSLIYLFGLDDERASNLTVNSSDKLQKQNNQNTNQNDQSSNTGTKSNINNSAENK